ncbi:hypothetical protein QE152_g6172 [Popillia japonica]|uniref:Uncharacterized protein n=1 Tax=Popillia japonica TaxID=7064 RepID=A0AAW1MJN5_POPJA
MNQIHIVFRNLSNDRCLRPAVLESEQVECQEQQEENNKVPNSPKRIWRKKQVESVLSDYNEPEGPGETLFADCETPTDVFRKVLGDIVEQITF